MSHEIPFAPSVGIAGAVDRAVEHVVEHVVDAAPADPAGDAFDPTLLADLEDDYEVLGELGRGASAVVYRARDRVIGREVAIKVVRADMPAGIGGIGESDGWSVTREMMARVAREARVVARLQHPNVVSVHAVRRLRQSGLALVMQLVPGRTLKQTILQDGPLAPERAERVLRDVARALAAAHACGIVHRDVKPENVFLDAESDRALLSDFGIARADDPDVRLTRTGAAVGTPAYMSPEQVDGGPVDERSDLYSLGLVAWEMLTGQRPWAGTGLFALLAQQKHGTLAPIEVERPAEHGAVPLRLQYVVERLIQKRPAARWRSAEALIAALDQPALPPDYERWLRAHRERVRAHRAARDAEGGGSTSGVLAGVPAEVVDAAGATARVTRPAPTEEERRAAAATAPAADPGDLPDWAIGPEAPRPRRRLVAAAAGAVVATLVGAAVALGAYRRDEPAPRVAATAIEGGDVRPTGVTASGTAVGSPAVRLTEPPPPAADSAVARAAAERAGGERAVTVPVAPPEAPRASAPAAPAPRATPGAPPDAPPPAATGTPTATPTVAVTVAVERGTVVAGVRHSCVLGAASAYCWGANDRGQLGGGGGDGQTAPVPVAGEVPFAQLSAGVAHTCGVTRSGDAYCWGNDEHGELGDATTISRDAPVRVAGTAAFRLVRAGRAHTCGLTAAGGVVCWGANADGQLGDGTTAGRTTPTPVAVGDVRFVEVAAGWRHSCALATTGAAYCWGANGNGQLGDGTRTDRRTPTRVAAGVRFVTLTAGSAHTCAVSTAGAVYCWGRNDAGQLGVGGSADRSAPARADLPAPAASVTAGGAHTCARARDGALLCWGRNTYGQLGDGTTVDRPTPVRAAGGATFASVSASGAHTCGRTSGGEIVCWGYNVDGQLGDGTRNHRAAPARVAIPTP